MNPFLSVTSKCLPLDRADVDTDQIIPAEYLKRIERSGFGQFLFEGLRQDPEFIFNNSQYDGAHILLAGSNFGCGSSREHAPWALDDYGIRAIIAPSFADIFRQNCVNVGICTAELSAAVVKQLIERSLRAPDALVTVDLQAQEVRSDEDVFSFYPEPFARERLLAGLDQVALTLRHEDEILAYEAAHNIG